MKLTRKEYEAKPKEYRGQVDGKPYLLTMNPQTGRTVYTPVEFVKETPILSLTCACCGNGTRGRQWWNRDTGYGLCPRCAAWIETRETPEAMQECYGRKGYHYAIEGEV